MDEVYSKEVQTTKDPLIESFDQNYSHQENDSKGGRNSSSFFHLFFDISYTLLIGMDVFI